MRHIRGTCWTVLTAFMLALTACSGTIGTSTRPTTATLSSVPSTVYLGIDTSVYALDAHTGSQRWKYDTGQPAASAGIYYLVVDAGSVFFKDFLGLLYAVDAATGAFCWKHRLDGIPSGLTVVSGVVYVTNKPSAYYTSTYAINVRTGKFLWQKMAGGAMAVTADTVYLVDGSPGSKGFVGAYDRLTGATRWQVKGHLYSGLQLGGSVIYATANNTVYAYDAHTGAQLWTKSFDNPITEGKLVGTTLYLNAFTRLYALNVTTHETLWQFTAGQLAGGDSLACLATGSTLYGLNVTTGTQLWFWQGVGYAPLSFYNGTCYTETLDPVRAPLYAIDAAAGKLRWSRDIKYIGVNNAIQPTADFVYVLSQDTTQCCASHVTALSSSNGATLWTFGAPSQVAGQFVLD